MNFVFHFFQALLSSYPLVAALLSVATAQSIKIIYYFILERPFRFAHLLEAGGMPSSHVALVTGLSVAFGWQEGWGSHFFVLSIIYGMVVMYDSTGVRRAAGRQAIVLNKMVKTFYREGMTEPVQLTELMGHSPLEVFVGAIVGITAATLLFIFSGLGR